MSAGTLLYLMEEGYFDNITDKDRKNVIKIFIGL
jgi:hypothetical protein